MTKPPIGKLVCQACRWLDVAGSHSVDHFHRELGKIVWDRIGMARTKAGLESALVEIPALREQFHSDVKVLGDGDRLNTELEKVGRKQDNEGPDDDDSDERPTKIVVD